MPTLAAETDTFPVLDARVSSMTEPDADGNSARDGGADSTDDTSDAASIDRTAENDGIQARYRETESERVLEFERVGSGAESTAAAATTATAAIAQNTEGYAMLKVRPTADGDELERYYGFDMALDHAAELLGVSPHDLPVPAAAEDLGM